LIAEGCRVVGLDNLCDFYNPAAKRGNLRAIAGHDRFELEEAEIRDTGHVAELFERHRPDAVVHLAAMAGVRPSIESPAHYAAVNVDGTVNLLDAAVARSVGRFVFASSSSVYGNNEKVPFAEDDPVDHPISPYAATKKSGELICHTYAHLYGLPIACLRFFTVFGPRQRPDLAIGKFMRRIAADQPIPVYGDGSTSRDYTYIDDIIAGVRAALDRCDRYRVYNLGHSEPVALSEMIAAIERVLGKEARIERHPIPGGDVRRTFADLTRARAELGYEPRIGFEEGLHRQWEWLRETEGW
jgi:UDP-glucuronate 4-epimerase